MLTKIKSGCLSKVNFSEDGIWYNSDQEQQGTVWAVNDGKGNITFIDGSLQTVVPDFSAGDFIDWSAGGASSLIPNLPYGETFTDQTDVVTPPTGSIGITVKCEPDSVDRIEISFDGGITYPFNMSQGESNTWDNVDLTNMRIRPVDSGTATFDIHGEYK